MNEIKCPKCGTVFQIDETDYDSIVKQIRDKEFEKEMELREKQYKLDKENAVKLAESHIKEELSNSINKKEIEINELKSELKNKEEQTKNKLEKDYQVELSKKNLEINELKNKIEHQKTQSELDIQKAIADKEKKINELDSELSKKNTEFALIEKSLKETYEVKLKDKDEQIAHYKDFKARQSTKMIGESLEQHCYIEFNRVRTLFDNCIFEKDNDTSGGSKGDFIFRYFSDSEKKQEIVSIMFEMKNEADETSTKHKNEDFFKKLDKDRNEKGCEYAVLVSLLEQDNDYYNDGIVDVSYAYQKMYVIRPQFFVPLITLITNLSKKSLDYKNELIQARNQNIDITHFEEKINTFKDSFGKNYRLASEKFKKAIEEIDKTIEHLQKTKDALLSSENNLRLANNKAEDITIRKLTSNSPTVKKMFDDLIEK